MTLFLPQYGQFSYPGKTFMISQYPNPDVNIQCFQDVIEVDAETKEMLKMMDFSNIPGLQMTTNARPGYNNRS